MKNLIAHVLIILFLATAIFGQVEERLPKLIDEFGRTNSENLMASLSGYMVQLGNDQNTRLQILTHRSEKDTFGYPYKLLAVMKAYMNMPEDRVITTNCEAKKERLTQVWLLSAKDEPINCSPDSFPTDQTGKFDTVYYSTQNRKFEYCCSVDYLFDDAQAEASLSAFASELKRVPESKAHIYLYRETNVYWRGSGNGKAKTIRSLDSFALLEKMRKNAVKILTRNGVDASRLVIKYGGFRTSFRNMELWLVPDGGATPKPKPDFVPKKKQKLKR